jgi:hypothetical protein
MNFFPLKDEENHSHQVFATTYVEINKSKSMFFKKKRKEERKKEIADNKNPEQTAG